MSQQHRPEADVWINRTVMDATGSKVGTVTDVHLNDTTKRLDWLGVSTGMFGTKLTFVPVAVAHLDGENVMVAYDKDTITAAPQVRPNCPLSVEDERRLHVHYGRASTPPTTTKGNPRRTADVSQAKGTIKHAVGDLTDNTDLTKAGKPDETAE